MEEVLTSYLLDERPYTHLNVRLRRFVALCQLHAPALPTRFLKKYVRDLAHKLMMGDVGKLWMRDRCFERTIRLYGKQDQRTDAWHTQRGTMITASEVSKVWTSPASRLELLLKKLEIVSGTAGNYNYVDTSSGEVIKFKTKDFRKTLLDNPVLKEQLYQVLCDKYVMKYKSDDIELSDELSIDTNFGTLD